jgi:uncharacterized protein (UPF0261 family)
MAQKTASVEPVGRIVFVVATLDTKSSEASFLRDALRHLGVEARVVDVGCLEPPRVMADVSREEIFASGGVPLASSLGRGDAITAAARGAAAWALRTYSAGQLAGIIGLGGSAGTTIATAAMRALPLGVPKLMVSTLASGQVRHYVADKDIIMANSIVDLAGLNRVTRQVLERAAQAMAGMVLFDRAPLQFKRDPAGDRPLVAATMFGVTTPCVERAKAELENAGYEVLVFHATGSGGQAMESLIREGLVAGVLDITTTELADELVGGVLSAGPDRLTAAARCGVPQVVSLGATDMVNFHGLSSVPERFRGRIFCQHNANVTLMRTNVDEATRIGADIGRKLSTATAAVTVLVPEQGVSAIDRQGQPFDDPVARRALVSALCSAAPALDVRSMECHINDPEFAVAAARRLIELIPAPTGKN